MTLKSQYNLLLLCHIICACAVGGFVYGDGLRANAEYAAAVQYVLFPLTGIIGVVRWQWGKIRKTLSQKTSRQ